MPPQVRFANRYRKALSRVTQPITCPDCGIFVLPNSYEKHCTDIHHFNSKLACAWCRVKTWASGQKYCNAEHLVNCFESFLQTGGPLRLLSPDHAYPEKDFFGHAPLDTGPVWPLECSTQPELFQDDNLNLAAAYLRQYARLKTTHDWLHVMVKAVAFSSFARAMDADGGTTRTLLFFCWCDGGTYEEARHRQHLHIIIVAPKGHFETRVWPKVRVRKEDKPVANFPCKRFKRIVSAMHLMNTLGYLSHRKSECNLGSDEHNLNHFYLNKTLPIEHKLQLVLVFPGGLCDLLYQEKFQNVSLPRVAEQPMTFDNGQWKQKIKHFYGHERGLVLPVRKDLAPTQDETDYVLYLMGDKKLYFQPCLEYEALDEETWIRKQAQGGNCFYDNVEEDMWIPRPRDQTVLTYHKPIVDQKAELESETASLKRKCEELEEECDGCKSKCKELEEENKSKQETINEQYKQYATETKRLKDKIHELYEGLKKENDQLKRKVCELLKFARVE